MDWFDDDEVDSLFNAFRVCFECGFPHPSHANSCIYGGPNA